MTPEYIPVSLDYVDEYAKLLTNSETNASDFSFGNIWGWSDYMGMEWKKCGEMCWLRQTLEEPGDWAPLGDWKKHDWASCVNLNNGMKFMRVPEQLLELWRKMLPPERIIVGDDRLQWDYLYLTEDLANLPGNRYHKKKNLVRQFKKNYNYTYGRFCSVCVDEVLSMQEEWIKWQDAEAESTLHHENRAIYLTLTNWNRLPHMVGAAIRVEGKIVAYTVGEYIREDTVIVHFEKGMPGYKGVYQAINNFFAQDIARDPKIKYINREQDMGDPGMRQAKESYHPVDYIKKYDVEILPA